MFLENMSELQTMSLQIIVCIIGLPYFQILPGPWFINSLQTNAHLVSCNKNLTGHTNCVAVNLKFKDVASWSAFHKVSPEETPGIRQEATDFQVD